MKKLFAIALLGSAIACSPALAQTAAPADRSPAATSGAAANKLMLKGNWRASKLMGLDVYNENNEKLGDVNEIILDKSGKVTAVVIGVGGFLGMLPLAQKATRGSSTTTSGESSWSAARSWLNPVASS